MWEAYRLFLEKKSLGSSCKLFRLGQRVLYQTLDDNIIGMLWNAEAEHNTFLMEEVYKQMVSSDCLHFSRP
jgi:hypothetical protein